MASTPGDAGVEAHFSGLNLGSQVAVNQGNITNNFHATQRPSSTTPPEPLASIPCCRDPDFISRGDILDQLHKKLQKPPHRAALVGLGGVGKSQLAIEYAHRAKDRSPRPWIFWINSETSIKVEDGLRNIAEIVQIPGRATQGSNILQLVYNWLSNERNGQWIIVLDSADDEDVFFSKRNGVHGGRELSTYLPQSNNGAFIITTRDRAVADKLTGHHDSSLDIGPMSDIEAIELLHTKLGLYKRWNADLAADLVRSLDYFAIAISQAASYLRQRGPRSSLEEYLQEFQAGDRKRERLLTQDADDHLRRVGAVSNAMLTTWKITYEHIRTKRPSAAELLALMSFFDRQGIPDWMLYPDVPSGHADMAEMVARLNDTQDQAVVERAQLELVDLLVQSSTVATSSDNSSEDESDGYSIFEEDIVLLRNFTLIAADEQGNNFEMHALVQFATRRWLRAAGLEEEFMQRFIHRFGHISPESTRILAEDWERSLELLPHALVASTYVPRAEEQLCWVEILYGAMIVARQLGQLDLVVSLGTAALSALRHSLGQESIGAMNMTLALAADHAARGDWEYHERLCAKVWAICGPNRRPALVVLAYFTVKMDGYAIQGRHEEAIAEMNQALDFACEIWGPEHPISLTTGATAAETYQKAHKWDVCETTARYFLEKQKEVLGKSHLCTLRTMHVLGYALHMKDELTKAYQVQEELLPLARSALGPNNYLTMTIMENAARTLRGLGRGTEAVKLLKEASTVYRRVHGDDAKETIEVIEELGRWEDALVQLVDDQT